VPAGTVCLGRTRANAGAPWGSGFCKTVCDVNNVAPLCATAQACTTYYGFLGMPKMEAGGVCEAYCNPLDDNFFLTSPLTRVAAPAGNEGCFGYWSSVKGTPSDKTFTCARLHVVTATLDHRKDCTTADKCAASDGSPSRTDALASANQEGLGAHEPRRVRVVLQAGGIATRRRRRLRMRIAATPLRTARARRLTAATLRTRRARSIRRQRRSVRVRLTQGFNAAPEGDQVASTDTTASASTTRSTTWVTRRQPVDHAASACATLPNQLGGLELLGGSTAGSRKD